MLTVIAVVAAIRLLNAGETARHRAVRFLAAALLSIGLAALAGGTYHGFRVMMPSWSVTTTWKATMVAVGFASFSFAGSAVFSVIAVRARKPLLALLFLKLFVYLVWLVWNDDFRYAVYEYSPTMLAVLIAYLYAWRKLGDAAARWIVGGILVSFAAAFVQLGSLSFHQHFNHNDIYHVVQMVAVYLFYRGGLLLTDRV